MGKGSSKTFTNLQPSARDAARLHTRSRGPAREMMSTDSKKSEIATQPGKRTPAVVMTFSVSTVMMQFTHPMTNTRDASVDGASHDLRSVGSPATWSAQTKDTSATVGSLANAQNTSPASAMAPHTTSKAPIFHTAF